MPDDRFQEPSAVYPLTVPTKIHSVMNQSASVAASLAFTLIHNKTYVTQLKACMSSSVSVLLTA